MSKEYSCEVVQLARAAIMKYHKMGGLNNRNVVRNPKSWCWFADTLRCSWLIDITPFSVFIFTWHSPYGSVSSHDFFFFFNEGTIYVGLGAHATVCLHFNLTTLFIIKVLF